MHVTGGMTAQVLQYIEESYGVRPDYLWMKSPGNAAFRHPQDRKWFAALLSNISKKRLGLREEGAVDILDVKGEPIVIASLIDGRGILPGYHMNKEHWVSLLLDGSVPIETICALIDMSHEMTRPKRRAAVPSPEGRHEREDFC